MAILEINNLGISFGGLKAVDKLNMKIEENQLYGLIGPNGAGKTTVFNLLTGVYQATEGTFSFDGKEVKNSNPVKMNRMGIARTFQNIRLFSQMSVIDNVLAGFHDSVNYGLAGSVTHLGRFSGEEKNTAKKRLNFWKFLILIRKNISLHAICLTENSVSLKLPVRLQQILSCCFWTSLRQE